MPLADDRRLAELYHDQGDEPAVIAQRLNVREVTVRRWLGLRPLTRPGRAERPARTDRYADEPTTPRARRVWDAWRSTPRASTADIARRAEVSHGYASRLIGHWKAQEAPDGA